MLAVVTSEISFASADLGRPFGGDSWWQCMLTCVTIWLGLAFAFALTCLQHYVGLACKLDAEQGEGSLSNAEATTNGGTSSSAVARAVFGLFGSGAMLWWPGAAFVGSLSAVSMAVIWCVLYRAFEFPPS